MIMKKIIYSAITVACYCMLLIATTSCEGSDKYEVGAPAWLSDKNAEEVKKDVVEVTPTPTKLGAEDNSTAWFTVFTDDVKIEPGKTAQVKFINYGSGMENYHNFALILRKGDLTLGGAGEYALFRADNYGWCNGNFDDKADQYCTYETEKDRDWSAWLESMKMAKVTMEINNKGGGKVDVKCTMLGADGGSYTQNYLDLSGLGIDENDLYFSITLEKAHLEFGDIEIKEAQPERLELKNVPASLNIGDNLSEVLADVTADVYFTGVTAPKTVKADDLQFSLQPDATTAGEKTLVAVYNKSLLGKAAKTAAVGTAKVNLVAVIQSIAVTKQPTVTTYDNVFSNGYPFLTQGLEVTATYSGGYTGVIGLDQLTFSTVPTTVGTHNITISTANGKTATVQIKVNSVLSTILTHPSPKTLGAEDNSAGFFSATTQNFKAESGKTYQVNFQNYGGNANYKNFLLVLRKSNVAGAAGEYAVLRSDNFGWGNGWADTELAQHCTPSMEEGRDWPTWLKAMSNARVFSAITNKGDGTVDVRFLMQGKDGVVYKQDYIGVTNNIDVNDVNVAFTLEGCHLVFE